MINNAFGSETAALTHEPEFQDTLDGTSSLIEAVCTHMCRYIFVCNMQKETHS